MEHFHIKLKILELEYCDIHIFAFRLLAILFGSLEGKRPRGRRMPRWDGNTVTCRGVSMTNNGF
jgi:hypothetical protein